MVGIAIISIEEAKKTDSSKQEQETWNSNITGKSWMRLRKRKINKIVAIIHDKHYKTEGWVDASGNGFTPDPKRHFAVHARGKSMEPLIHDGDICVFEWYKAGSRNDEILLTQCSERDLDYGGKYTIKKYHSEKVVTEEGWQHSKVELIPLNKDYNVIELDENTVYRTIGILKCVL